MMPIAADSWFSAASNCKQSVFDYRYKLPPAEPCPTHAFLYCERLVIFIHMVPCVCHPTSQQPATQMVDSIGLAPSWHFFYSFLSLLSSVRSTKYSGAHRVVAKHIVSHGSVPFLCTKTIVQQSIVHPPLSVLQKIADEYLSFG
jgi:hypothetical protein